LPDIPCKVVYNEQNLMKTKQTKTLNTLPEITKLTIEELIEAYAFSDAIVETVREPLLILDGDLHIKRANSAFFKTFKVNKKDTLNCLIYDLGNKQWDIPKLRELLLEILPEKKSFNDFEVIHRFQTIGNKHMLLNARQIVLDGYKTKLILLAIEDITERRLLEKQRDALVGSAGHELKTPLTSIKIYTQLLLKNPNRKELITFLEKIDSKVNVLNKLVEDILNMSKMGAGKLKIKKETFNMDDCVKGIVEDLKAYSENHTLTKVGNFTATVIGDQKLICQVVTNLILNAIKYSPKAKKIIVTSQIEKDMLKVSVQDFGMGVPKKDHNHIFEPFYRTENKKKERIPGFGLGLYISSEIIAAHGGSLQVESDGKKGSLFYFLLPLKQSVT
jgi:signal transduction histidine kinase